MRYAVVLIDITLYSDDSNTLTILKGTVVAVSHWYGNYYSVWVHEYSAMCTAADLDFLDE